MAQLHVLYETSAFRQRLQRQGLEDHVRYRLPGKDRSGDNLGDDVD